MAIDGMHAGMRSVCPWGRGVAVPSGVVTVISPDRPMRMVNESSFPVSTVTGESMSRTALVKYSQSARRLSLIHI